MLLPALFVFVTIIYYPLLSSVKWSFTDWNMSSPTYAFVGLRNFGQMFHDELIVAGFRNTIVFTLYATFCGNALALLLALALDKRTASRTYLRAVFYIPSLICTIVVSAVFSNLLQYYGFFNELFTRLHLDFLVNDWFANKKTALPLLIMLNAWQWAGYGSVVYLAGLQTIPTEYYEAARIEGARGVPIFFRITFPLLIPYVTIMTFMSITGGLKLFEIPYVLTGGGPGHATETMGTVIYRVAYHYNQFGYATSIAVVFFLMIALFSILQITFTRKREVQL
jgi:raffinose/stachyose/melibiose transport system permease protein